MEEGFHCFSQYYYLDLQFNCGTSLLDQPAMALINDYFDGGETVHVKVTFTTVEASNYDYSITPYAGL